MIIRPVRELHELQRCIELQRETWGLADSEVVPIRMFVTQNRIGGLVLGAFEGERLIGFVNAMPGIRGRMPYWYSEMLAVASDQRNTGIGSQLKRAQRDIALQRGIELIEWTFDPLESKNAYLNIAKLGVIALRYHVNLYGATMSALQSGLESDRLIGEWWIARPRVTMRGDVRRITIPADIQDLKKHDLKAAQQLQLRVREQFLRNFQDDYFVAGFERSGNNGEYILLSGASRVHSAG